MTLQKGGRLLNSGRGVRPHSTLPVPNPLVLLGAENKQRSTRQPELHATPELLFLDASHVNSCRSWLTGKVPHGVAALWWNYSTSHLWLGTQSRGACRFIFGIEKLWSVVGTHFASRVLCHDISMEGCRMRLMVEEETHDGTCLTAPTPILSCCTL